MLKGINFALAACFVWGLIFVVPQFMDGFSAIEVALARYLFYGLISAAIFLKTTLQGRGRYPRKIWIQALYFSFASTIFYYTCVVLSLRYATPAICALVLGISPITIALYGNYKERECSFKSLLLPSILILVGLMIINAPYLYPNNLKNWDLGINATSSSTHVLGIVFSFLALLSWSWYAVANSKFFKVNPQISCHAWSTLVGVATLFWVAFFALVLGLFFTDLVDISKCTSFSLDNTELLKFLIGGAILGILCSWVGASLWNSASIYLPVSLAGQLTIFETIFGLVFVYLLKQEIPPLFECVGIVFLFFAIFLGIRSTTKMAVQHSQ